MRGRGEGGREGIRGVEGRGGVEKERRRERGRSRQGIKKMEATIFPHTITDQCMVQTFIAL